MIKYMAHARILLLCLYCIGLLAPPALADSSANVYEKSLSTKALGRAVGAKIQTGNTDSSAVFYNILLTVLGASMQALSALQSPPNTIGGTTYTEVYSFGKRVLSDSFFSKPGEAGTIHVGLTPTEVRAPLILYPVGPLTLQIDGGARFQADLKLKDTIVLVLNDDGTISNVSNIGVLLEASATGSGFIEGYAKFLMLRAGVGGLVDLIDAKALVGESANLSGKTSSLSLSVVAEFLQGRFYAFLDLFSFLQFGWRRLLDYNLYSWNGFCFATGSYSCSR